MHSTTLLLLTTSSLLLLTSATIPALPRHHILKPQNPLHPRQLTTCDGITCGAFCVPISDHCCSDGGAGCPIGSNCVPNGCCPNGESCSGGGGTMTLPGSAPTFSAPLINTNTFVDTDTNLFTDTDTDTSFSEPTFSLSSPTEPSFTHTFTTPTFSFPTNTLVAPTPVATSSGGGGQVISGGGSTGGSNGGGQAGEASEGASVGVMVNGVLVAVGLVGLHLL